MIVYLWDGAGAERLFTGDPVYFMSTESYEYIF